MLRFLAPGLCVLLGLAILVPRSLSGDEQQAVRKPYDPKIFGPSTEPAMAIQRIRVPKGLQVGLFAAEPMLANPVCFCVDEKNRFYVAETFRLHDGVTDVRGHMDWLDGDLASRTVADRVALMKKHLGKQVKKWTVEHERIRLLEDTKAEDARQIRLITAQGHVLDVPKSQVEERTRGKSAMPEDVTKHLSKSEVRNLVEFLAGLK